MKWLVLLLLISCEREERTHPTAAQAPLGQAPLVSTYAGSTPPIAGSALPAGMPGYRETAYVVAEGKTLYRAFNCIGCHGAGGGAIGPAFIDRAWIYGADPNSVAVSIIAGRPQGMPSYRGRLGKEQLYQLVAYTRSLGGLVRGDAMQPRDDHAQTIPVPSLDENGWPHRGAKQ